MTLRPMRTLLPMRISASEAMAAPEPIVTPWPIETRAPRETTMCETTGSDETKKSSPISIVPRFLMYGAPAVRAFLPTRVAPRRRAVVRAPRRRDATLMIRR
jgi:hypothetical protein